MIMYSLFTCIFTTITSFLCLIFFRLPIHKITKLMRDVIEFKYHFIDTLRRILWTINRTFTILKALNFDIFSLSKNCWRTEFYSHSVCVIRRFWCSCLLQPVYSTLYRIAATFSSAFISCVPTLTKIPLYQCICIGGVCSYFVLIVVVTYSSSTYSSSTYVAKCQNFAVVWLCGNCGACFPHALSRMQAKKENRV